MKSRQLVHRHGVVAATLLVLACGGNRDSADYETVFSVHPSTWFEDGWTHYEVSANDGQALFGKPFSFRLIDLTTGQEDSVEYRGALDEISSATFDADGDLVRWGTVGEGTGWYQESVEGLHNIPIPPDAVPAWSPDGSTVAYRRWTEPGVFVGPPEEQEFFDLDGDATGLVWSPAGDCVYVLAVHLDGLSALLRIEVASGAVTTVQSELDAVPQFSSMGVSTDGSKLYLALAGADKPDPEARHEPNADRDTDIYELDVATSQLRPVVETEGDDFHPVVAGQNLYWTHNDVRDQVVILPISGGDAMVVVEDAQIPYWSPDGLQLAFTYGGWRIADWALNFDAGFVELNESARRVSDRKPIVVGYHEDFTPAWSPDGSWIAYHSHRSDHAVPSYSAEGSTDDIFLRRPTAPVEDEIRLTDFGWEVGMADWAPDGTRLVFDSWEREGVSGWSKPWIATIDTASGQALGVERLPLPDGVKGTLFAAWSPTDDRIAFVEQKEEEGRRALWVVRADGTHPLKLVDYESSTYGGLDWTPDGRTIVFAALAESVMQLHAIPAVGGQPEQITHDAASLIHPQISPDGRWVAATRLFRVKELRRMVLPPT